MEDNLHYCTEISNLVILSRLLAHKDINVNVRDKTGQTPLNSAATNSRLGSLQLLLFHEDIEVNMEDT